MRRQLVLIVISICTAVTMAKGQDTQTILLNLAQCEEIAFENNMSIKNAEQDLRLSKAKKTQADHAKVLPKLEITNIWGPSPVARGVFTDTGVLVSPDTSTGPGDLRYFTEVEFNLLQPIFTFGKLSNLSKAAGYGVQAGEANVIRSREDTRLRVRELYWALLLGKELLVVVEEAQSEAAKAGKKIQEQLDEGSDEVDQNDLYKLQLFQYDINKKQRQVLDNTELAKSALRITLGLPEEVRFDIQSEYLDPVEKSIDDFEVYLRMGLENRAVLRQLRAGINARRALRAVSRSDYFPQFFFGGQIKYNFAKDRFDSRNPFVYNPTNYFRPGFVFGLKMNLNFWQTRDKVRLAEIEYRKLSEQEESLIEGIKLEVRRAYLAVKQSGTNLRESRRALRASNNWLRSATMTFDIGVGEVKNLIDAFKENGKMQSEHFQNIFSFNVSLAKLSQASGRDLY